MSELKEAFRESVRREFADIPPESEIEWEFSPRFQRKMRRLIHAYTYGYWNLFNTAAKRAVCVAAIIVLLLTSVMAIKPIRQRVIQFFVEVYEDYFEITFGEKESRDLPELTEPMVRYTLTELPDGYEEVEFMELDSLYWTSWKNESGDGISLKQESGTNNVYFDNTDGRLPTIQHGELSITYQNLNGTQGFMWEQDGYVFLLSVYDEFTTEQILVMIASLAPVEK